jgi:ankyrin repeat protein
MSYLWVFLLVVILLARASNDVRNELLEAAHSADYELVKLLLGLDPTVLSSRPPVIVDRVEEVYGRTALLVCGLNPNNKDTDALDKECLKIAKALHAKGANMAHVDNNGWDAVSIGASRGLSRYCKYLITQHNVDPNRADSDGRTSLMKAAAHGHFETFVMLLNYTADPASVEHQAGMSALHFATVHALQNAAHIQFLRNVTGLLTSENTANGPWTVDTFEDKYGRTPLMYAAISNNPEVVEVLLAAGADPRLADSYGVICSTMPANDELRLRLVNAAIALTEAEHERWLHSTTQKLAAEL